MRPEHERADGKHQQSDNRMELVLQIALESGDNGVNAKQGKEKHPDHFSEITRDQRRIGKQQRNNIKALGQFPRGKSGTHLRGAGNGRRRERGPRR